MKQAKQMQNLFFAGCLALTLGACGDDDGNGSSQDFLSCQDECQVDADCDITGEGDGQFICGNNKRCEQTFSDSSFDLCQDDVQCRASFFFVEYCFANEDCDTDGGGTICVEGGDGNQSVCAVPEEEGAGCTFGDPLPATLVGSGDEVTVCGLPDAECKTDTGACRIPCKSDTDCTTDSFPSCNVETGDCNCTATSCEGSGSGDSCVNNNTICGCTEVSECDSDTPYPNITKVCETPFL